MEKLTKNQAQAKITRILADMKAQLEKAVALADEHNITFHYELPMTGTVTYVPNDGTRPTIEDYWENGWEESGPEGWDGQYAGWQNSSTFC